MPTILGFKFKLEGLYFTTFRKPTSTSLILSYSIPPYTTVRGVLANALGLKRDDLSIQDWIELGIVPLNFTDKSKEIAKILKLKGTGETHQKVFPSSPMSKEFLVLPSYDIYVAGEKNRINTIYSALLQPARPLYLGASDDLVDIELTEPVEVRETLGKKILGVIEGIYEDSYVERIPYKFIKKGKNFSLEYKTVSVPKNRELNLKSEVKCWQFNDVNIWLA